MDSVTNIADRAQDAFQKQVDSIAFTVKGLVARFTPTRPVLIPTLKIVCIAGLMVVLGPTIMGIKYLRYPFKNTKIGNVIFCKGKELCSDYRCVGEDYILCKDCPAGKAQAVYKVTCAQDEKSTCTFRDNMCVDKPK